MNTNTTKTNTTTNNTNAIQRESLFAATNFLCHQRFKMDAENKARVSAFIARNAIGKVKVEFCNRLPEGIDRMEIRHEDMLITLVYTSDVADTIYVGVTANKAPENAPDEHHELNSYAEPKKPTRELLPIIGGTVKYVMDMLYDNFHIDDIDGKVNEAVRDFLIAQDIKGHVKALGCAKFPEGVSAQETVTFGDYSMELSFAANKVNPKNTPHVLWFMIRKSDEVKERELKEAAEKNFRSFWKKNNLPPSLLDEALQVIDVTGKYMVLVYKTAKDWVDARMKEKDEIKFLGQKPDPNSGGFVPNKPIGYVVNGKIVITNPAAKFAFRAFPF